MDCIARYLHAYTILFHAYSLQLTRRLPGSGSARPAESHSLSTGLFNWGLFGREKWSHIVSCAVFCDTWLPRLQHRTGAFVSEGEIAMGNFTI